MRIEHIGRSTVKITVSGRELARSGLTVSDIDGKSPLAVMLLSGLVEKVYPGCDIGKLNAEVFHTGDSGCILYLSKTSEEQVDSFVKTVITADSVEKLISLCGLLSRMDIDAGSSIVVGEKSALRLIVSLPDDHPALTGMLMRRAELVRGDSHVIAHIMEHGRVIVPANAVETLAKLAEPLK